MNLTIERVRVADIEPLRDEYGNEFVSRDYELPANKEYVRLLAESFGPDGEPDEQVKLIRNGRKYAIKAGNSRVRAMQLLGTEECWAVIDEDDTVQGVVETVVRTNTKKKYEATEESRFTQQLAAFGDDEYVSGVASIDVDKARRMRKAREIVGERAEQLSLDRLYVIPDFEGDADAIKRIEAASEKDWYRVKENLMREKVNRETADAFRAAARDFKVKLLDSRPHDLRYICTVDKPENLKADYFAASVDYKDIAMMVSDSWYVEANLFGLPLNEEKESEEESERRRIADEYKGVATRIDDDCCNWVLDQLSDDDAQDAIGDLANLDKACRKVALGYWYLSDALKMFPRAKKEKNCLVLFALGYKNARQRLAYYAADLANEKPSERACENIASALDWVALHEADGWEPDEGQREFLDMARSKAAKADDDDGEGAK